MIAAPDPLTAGQVEFERGAASMQFQQANGVTLVAEGDDVFAQLTGENDWLPELPQVFPAWCARSNPGQLLVFRRSLAMVVGAVGPCSGTAPAQPCYVSSERFVAIRVTLGVAALLRNVRCRRSRHARPSSMERRASLMPGVDRFK